MTEEKIDKILKSLRTLKKSQNNGQNIIKRHLDQLERMWWQAKKMLHKTVTAKQLELVNLPVGPQQGGY